MNSGESNNILSLKSFSRSPKAAKLSEEYNKGSGTISIALKALEKWFTGLNRRHVPIKIIYFSQNDEQNNTARLNKKGIFLTMTTFKRITEWLHNCVFN